MTADLTLMPQPSATGAPRGATRAVMTTEARLFLREPQALFWILVFPSVLLVILGLIPAFREPSADLGGQRVIDLYLPIVILLSMLMAALQSMPPVLVGYRERGVLRRLAVTPMRPASLLVAQIAVHAVAVLASTIIALVVGKVAFDVKLPQAPVGWLFAYVLALLAALAIGGTLSALAPTTKVSATIGTILFFPMMFSAGLWLPVSTMPSTLRTIVEILPMGAASQALTDAAAGSWPQWWQLGIVAAWIVVLIAAAARFFRWE